MASRLTLIALCLVTSGAVAAGQDQGVFRRDVQTVAIYATVMDPVGRLVPDLEREHFEVLDDGLPQSLTLFRSDVQPISVVVMLDTSGSMTLNIDLLKRAAEAFIIRLHPQDRGRIGSFSDTIRIDPPQFTSNRDDLIRVLHTDIRYGNPTFLWDAIHRAMNALATERGRRVVLVFTDGDDQKSVETDFEQLLARVQADETMIYGIGLHGEVLGVRTRPDRRLRTISAVTGGGYYELTNTSEIGPTFSRIADELHRQYVIGFSPKTLDGKVHALDVKVKVEGMTARARKSYVATKPTGGGSD
jgi:VWFA-related protein